MSLLLAAELLIKCPASGTAASKSKSNKKKRKTEEVAKPKVDKYTTKMFVNDKSPDRERSVRQLHKLKGKLYVEVLIKTIAVKC